MLTAMINPENFGTEETSEGGHEEYLPAIKPYGISEFYQIIMETS